MTDVILLDGTGSGQQAAVRSNRLLSDSVSRDIATVESLVGNAFNISTGAISLTSANKSAVLYVKNNGDDSLILETLILMFGISTGGAGDLFVNTLRNPTTGTIVTNALAAEVEGSNRNNGSSKLLDADVFKGVEGDTFTSGEKQLITLTTQKSAGDRIPIPLGNIILTKGASFGVDFTPATGNTLLNVVVSVACYVNGAV